MKSLLLLPLLVLGARAEPCYLEIFSDVGQTGNSSYYNNTGYLNDLGFYGLNDDIESVRQTGMWLYYENEIYNIFTNGSVYYVHGIDIAVTFPAEYRNIMSSIRRAGCWESLNDDIIMVYDYTTFAGGYAIITSDDHMLASMGGSTSSIIVTGPSPWTVYTGQNYTGSSWCLENTDHDVGDDGTTLDLGIFPYVEDIGIPDNSLWSVRKGCFTARVAEAPKLDVEGRQENGAWGRLM